MTDSLDQELRAAQRLLAYKDARDDLMEYLRLQMPDPAHIDDVTRSRYIATPLARILTDIVHRVERGELKRVAVSVGPQFGKSQILSRAAPAWLSGRHPHRNMILGTYNQTFADEFGKEVRAMVTSNVHKAIFPEYELAKGGTASDLLSTTAGGKMAFVGMGGSGTGKPADYFFVDDPIRGDADAQSEVYREALWKWFTGTVFSRTLADTAIVVVHTRWHQDDLIGRLCDPDHPERNRKYANIKGWTYINLPAVITDPKQAKDLGLRLAEQEGAVREQFGMSPMASLDPIRKPLPLLAEAQGMDPRVFGALYLGRPAPEDGDIFKADMLVEYARHELPSLSRMRFYGASDHAVTIKKRGDNTVLGVVGIDSDDTIWVLPDVRMARMETDKTVDGILHFLKEYNPVSWTMESEMISKAFGPFLKKRLLEERLFPYIQPIQVNRTDKVMRSSSIQGRLSMGKVRFPGFAPWWAEARAQLLNFPYGAHDDFVDWLSLIGLGLPRQLPASKMLQLSDEGFHRNPLTAHLERVLQRAKKPMRIARYD